MAVTLLFFKVYISVWFDEAESNTKLRLRHLDVGFRVET
jgi:hypothetical protein